MKKDESDISFTTAFMFLAVIVLRKLFYFLTDLSVYPPFSTLFSPFSFHYTRKDYFLVLDIFSELRFSPAKFTYQILEIDHTFVYTEVIFLNDNRLRKRFFYYLKRDIGEDNYYLTKLNEKTYKINFVRDRLSRKMLNFA